MEGLLVESAPQFDSINVSDIGTWDETLLQCLDDETLFFDYINRTNTDADYLVNKYLQEADDTSEATESLHTECSSPNKCNSPASSYNDELNMSFTENDLAAPRQETGLVVLGVDLKTLSNENATHDEGCYEQEHGWFRHCDPLLNQPANYHHYGRSYSHPYSYHPAAYNYDMRPPHSPHTAHLVQHDHYYYPHHNPSSSLPSPLLASTPPSVVIKTEPQSGPLPPVSTLRPALSPGMLDSYQATGATGGVVSTPARPKTSVTRRRKSSTAASANPDSNADKSFPCNYDGE